MRKILNLLEPFELNEFFFSNLNSRSRTKSRVDPVEVYCRVRPLPDGDNDENCLKILDECNLMLQIPEVS